MYVKESLHVLVYLVFFMHVYLKERERICLFVCVCEIETDKSSFWTYSKMEQELKMEF